MSRPTPDRRHHAVVLGPPGGGWPEPGDFGAWCAAHRGAECTLWLAGALTRPLLADAVADFSDATMLAAWSRRVLADYEDAAEAGGAAPVAPWRSGERSGACVLAAGFDLDACLAAAAQHDVRLLGVHPLWAGALALLESDPRGRAALAAAGTLLVADGPQASVLRWRGGALVDLQQRWLASAEASELDRLAVEAPADPGRSAPLFAVGHGLVGPHDPRMQVLGRLDQDADALRARLPRRIAAPDFARPPAAPLRPWAQRAFAATALAVLALAVHDAWSVRDAGEAALAEGDAVPLARPRAAFETAAAAESRAASASDPLATAARLQHPWHQLFAAVESTALDGEWLVLEHRAQQAAFRLGGLASSSAQAMATARALAAADGVDDALVSRVEPVTGGRHAFEISGRLEASRAGAGVAR